MTSLRIPALLATTLLAVFASGARDTLEAQAPPGGFTLAQTLSDQAQRTTLAFSGLAIMTGNLEAQSFFPPGKVADWWGFQCLRDNDPSQMGHAGDFLTSAGIGVPLINVPGCPPHPDWMVGTVVHLLKFGIPALDSYQRPTAFFSSSVHSRCPHRDWGDEVNAIGQRGCMKEIGCRGESARGDCPVRRWNGGTNWVIGAGAPCQGCTQPEYPDQVAPCYEKLSEDRLPKVGTAPRQGGV